MVPKRLSPGGNGGGRGEATRVGSFDGSGTDIAQSENFHTGVKRVGPGRASGTDHSLGSLENTFLKALGLHFETFWVPFFIPFHM